MIICTFMAFPAVFMMRVIGLYGLYFKPDLSIVNEFPDNEPAGFGPRYLAYMIDYFVVVVVVALFGGGFSWIAGLFMIYVGLPGAALPVAALVRLITSTFVAASYFAKGESGAARATLGKWSLGLIVLRDDNTPMTFNQAFGRALSAFLTALTFYIGFLICVFRTDKKAMHDLMSKSKVVWRGEEN